MTPEQKSKIKKIKQEILENTYILKYLTEKNQAAFDALNSTINDIEFESEGEVESESTELETVDRKELY